MKKDHDKRVAALKEKGEYLKEKRKAKDLTVKELSKQSGVNPNYIRLVEKGEPMSFRDSKWIKLADVLGADVDKLRGAVKEPTLKLWYPL